MKSENNIMHIRRNTQTKCKDKVYIIITETKIKIKQARTTNEDN